LTSALADLKGRERTVLFVSFSSLTPTTASAKAPTASRTAMCSALARRFGVAP